MKRRQPAKPQRPADAKAAAGFVRTYTIGLFDRQDGHAADWSLIAETLFRAAFEAVETVLDEARRLSLLRRVHEGSYSRLTASPMAESGPPCPSEKSAAVDPAEPAISQSPSR